MRQSDKLFAEIQQQLALVEDLRSLMTLERRLVDKERLSTRDVITLDSLRSYYPRTATRVREEIIQGTLDEEDLINYMMTSVAPHDLEDHQSEPDEAQPDEAQPEF